MYEWMNKCMYVCMYAFLNVYVHVNIQTHISINIYLCMSLPRPPSAPFPSLFRRSAPPPLPVFLPGTCPIRYLRSVPTMAASLYGSPRLSFLPFFIFFSNWAPTRVCVFFIKLETCSTFSSLRRIPRRGCASMAAPRHTGNARVHIATMRNRREK